jgi:hypothetical protein
VEVFDHLVDVTDKDLIGRLYAVRYAVAFNQLNDVGRRALLIEVVLFPKRCVIFPCSFSLTEPPLNIVELQNVKLLSALTEPVRTAAHFTILHSRALLRQIYQKFMNVRLMMQGAGHSLIKSPRLAELVLYSSYAGYMTSKAQTLLGYGSRFPGIIGLKQSILWLDPLGLLS